MKIEAIKDWPRPNNVMKVRSFLGLDHYYRRFIECFFPKIVVPLTKLMRKNIGFTWEEKQENSFQELKDKLTLAPVLATPSGTEGLYHLQRCIKVGVKMCVDEA